MKPGKWLIGFVITTFIIIGIPVFSIMGFNYYIDPLWNFTHANEHNDFQIGFDERQQKTNYINSHEFDYDSLLIGTSRITYFDATEFENESVFNYSLSSLYINEYKDYIRYAEKKNGKPFKNIYIEFYSYSYRDEYGVYESSAQEYIDIAEEPFYKITSLFSKSTFDAAKDNLEISSANSYEGFRYYDRNLVAKTETEGFTFEEAWAPHMRTYGDTLDKPVAYYENYKDVLIDLKNTFPESNFIVFTDLRPEPFISQIFEYQTQQEAYERWVHELVDVFGTVYSFHGYNSITKDYETYFFDLYHYYPEVASMIIDALQTPNENHEIMYVVTKENIEQYFNSLDE